MIELSWTVLIYIELPVDVFYKMNSCFIYVSLQLGWIYCISLKYSIVSNILFDTIIICMHQKCLISLVLSVHNKHTYKPKYHAAHLLKICYHIKTYETLTGQKYLENIYDWYDNNNKKERKNQPPFHFFF